MSQKKLFLLDAFALIYRAHFAMSKFPRLTTNGINTGAILGFTNTLVEIIQKENPSHIAVVFDTPEPTFRHKMYEDYKATRESQPEEITLALPYCKKILEGMNISIIEKEGYEADDLIGTLAKNAAKKEYCVYMMTPDKDYAQLVSENIFLYKPARMGNGVEIMGISEVLEKFDIQKVDQVRDILGLKGDAVDNIPGVPGIGEKTASRLLKEYESVEKIVENTHNLKGATQEKFKKNGQLGILSKQLATIKTDCPIEIDLSNLSLQPPNKEVLLPIFRELEFKTLSRRLFDSEDFQNLASQKPSLFPQEEETLLKSDKKNIQTENPHYELIETEEALKDLIHRLSQSQSFCFDTETTGLSTRSARLLGIAFSLQPKEAYYVPIPTSYEAFLQIIKPILENEKIIKIGQNLKYDIQILKNYGIEVHGPIFDTLLAHFILDPESANGMDPMADKYLNYTTLTFEDIVGPKGKNQKTLDQIPISKVKNYACEDADITLQLSHIFEKEIAKKNLEKLLHEIEEPLSFVLADMEYEGIKVDTDTLLKLSKTLDTEKQSAEKTIFEIAGLTFNLQSPKQLGEVLFEKMKIIDNPKKTKTGQYATGEEILSKLSSKHPIAKKILEYREYQKLKSTYVDALPKLINKHSGRIHTDFRQTIATTGRLSSNHPNLQNIPIRTQRGREIRKAFVPKDGYLLMSADYSQIELRIMASFSNDEHMMEAFSNGRDIHATTAAKVFGVEENAVDVSMRRKAKEVNFGIIYGISAFGLSQNLNISREEAHSIIHSYFNEFPNVKKYMNESIQKAKEKEYVSTILGRVRHLRNINSRNPTMRGFDERNAINTPIQGSAADIIKMAMIAIHKWMKKEKLQSKMLLQVHDELVFEVHPDEKDLMAKHVESLMCTANPLKVPLEVQVGMGNNWLEAH